MRGLTTFCEPSMHLTFCDEPPHGGFAIVVIAFNRQRAVINEPQL